MKLVKLAAGCVAASYLFTAAPAFALIYNNPIDASLARCTSLAGREKDRCMSIHRRVERLRLRQTSNSFLRGNTQREQRVIQTQQNYGENSARRIRGFDLSRLRSHNRDGGNARRLINQRDEQAREACRNVDSTEKAQCIREQWRALSRGNTR